MASLRQNSRVASVLLWLALAPIIAIGSYAGAYLLMGQPKVGRDGMGRYFAGAWQCALFVPAARVESMLRNDKRVYLLYHSGSIRREPVFEVYTYFPKP